MAERLDKLWRKPAYFLDVKEFFNEQKKALEAVIYGKYAFVNGCPLDLASR